MSRLLICLACFLAAPASYAVQADTQALVAKHVDTWFDSNYPILEILPSSDAREWPVPADTKQACVDVRQWLCMDEPRGDVDPDRVGLKRDTYYFLGYQVASIGILYVMPESISSWSKEDKEQYSLSKWWDNVSNPTWDKDDFFLNYVTHPYWGAAYFVRARERGYTNWQSFWYSAMLSSMYEFGAEALFEPASIQDLIVTPVLGSLLGRYFVRVRENVDNRSIARGYTTTKDKWVLALTDPLGGINRQVNKWLGLETELQVRPFVQLNRPGRYSVSGPLVRTDDRAIGLAISLQW